MMAATHPLALVENTFESLRDAQGSTPRFRYQGTHDLSHESTFTLIQFIRSAFLSPKLGS